jgi:hypothetical protein
MINIGMRTMPTSLLYCRFDQQIMGRMNTYWIDKIEEMVKGEYFGKKSHNDGLTSLNQVL